MQATINAAGIAEIHAFLAAHHKPGDQETRAIIVSWVEDRQAFRSGGRLTMTKSIRIETDERGHHAVVVTVDDKSRVFFRHATASVAGAACASLRRDIARHGEDVIGFDALPVAEYRTTKAGRRLLVA